MRPIDLFRGLRGSMGGVGSRGQGGHLGDSLELSGRFDESSDDSCGMYVSDPNFSCVHADPKK